MYADAAPFYDIIHDARGRNADSEAELVIGEIRHRAPAAKTLLDVGCGTGAHLPRFARDFDAAGVDLSEQMLAIAAVRCPDLPLTEGDFRSFDLGRRFDAIVCLFSGIGYLLEERDLREAVVNLARHLEPGGVLLIEGWVEPGYWIGSNLNAEAADSGGVAVARSTRSSSNGVLCDIFMRYTASLPDQFVTIDEHHQMRLSDPAEVARAFEAADLAFERLPHMLHPGRAVWVGTPR